MRLNILIGGEAGQGINKISEIVSNVLRDYGYFTFNYRDYPSLIRGGHNFNVLSVSDTIVRSNQSTIDIIVAMDYKTVKLHTAELIKDGLIIDHEKFKDLGRNINVAQSGALMRVLGIDSQLIINEVKKQFNNEDSNKAALLGFKSQKTKYKLGKLDNKIIKFNGNAGVAKGAVNSGINLYFGYPMTPSTGVLHKLADMQKKYPHMVFQAENEIAVVNVALGASFTGAKTMIGTSGGGFDLMTEGLSLQGISEVPLVVYLASRPGPASGIPTYTTQGDLNLAIKSSHGEFPRVVIAPGDPIEAIEKTNEAFYLSEKFKCLSIVLGDKHLAESEFSINNKTRKVNKVLAVNVKRAVPGKLKVVRANSYEHNEEGYTTEDAKIAYANGLKKIEKYKKIKEEVKKFEMYKIHGNKNSKNLIVAWGSTKGAILDAIKGEDYKFLQILYCKPMSDEILDHLKSAEKIIIIENNLTGQMGRLIREKSGFKIENRILRFDGRPFLSDELKKQILAISKKQWATPH